MLARLIVEAGEASPSMLELTPDGSTCLGRNRRNNVILRDPHASRFHAKIFQQDGFWCLRDDSINGTRINGQLIRDSAVRLENGHAIVIGDVQMRFTVVDVSGLSPPPEELYPTLNEKEEGCEDTSTTLQVDELSALVRFLNDSTKEATAHGLLKLALHVVKRQTGADVCGFLNLNPDEPLPRVVVPNTGKVDVPLSKHLTNLALEEARTDLAGPVPGQ